MTSNDELIRENIKQKDTIETLKNELKIFKRRESANAINTVEIKSRYNRLNMEYKELKKSNKILKSDYKQILSDCKEFNECVALMNMMNKKIDEISKNRDYIKLLLSQEKNKHSKEREMCESFFTLFMNKEALSYGYQIHVREPEEYYLCIESRTNYHDLILKRLLKNTERYDWNEEQKITLDIENLLSVRGVDYDPTTSSSDEED
jgi:hypothetical protein